MSALTELQRLGQEFDREDDTPSCKVCGRKVCNHSDLEFAGVVPGEG